MIGQRRNDREPIRRVGVYGMNISGWTPSLGLPFSTSCRRPVTGKDESVSDAGGRSSWGMRTAAGRMT